MVAAGSVSRATEGSVVETCELLSTACPGAEPVHVQIHDRRRVQREHLADDKPSDNGDAQRSTQLRTIASAQSDGKASEKGRHRSHHDGTEAQQTRVIDRFFGGVGLIAFGLDGKIDHQDGVFLDDADQKDDADQPDDVEFAVRHQNREQRPNPGGGHRGENCDGVDVIFIEDAQDDVHSDQRRENEITAPCQGILEGLRCALESGVNGGWQADLTLDFCTALTASPRGTLGARLKVNVTAGNWP